MSPTTREDLQAAEAMIANAIAIMLPHCGEDITIAMGQQIVEDCVRSEKVRTYQALADAAVKH